MSKKKTTKPRIKIGEVYEVGGVTLVVPYEFDTGVRGTLNFPLSISEEEVVNALKRLYEEQKKKPDHSGLSGKEIE